MSEVNVTATLRPVPKGRILTRFLGPVTEEVGGKRVGISFDLMAATVYFDVEGTDASLELHLGEIAGELLDAAGPTPEGQSHPAELAFPVTVHLAEEEKRFHSLEALTEALEEGWLSRSAFHDCHLEDDAGRWWKPADPTYQNGEVSWHIEPATEH